MNVRGEFDGPVIVVIGNPLFDITALSHVEVVVKDWRRVQGRRASGAARADAATDGK